MKRILGFVLALLLCLFSVQAFADGAVILDESFDGLADLSGYGGNSLASLAVEDGGNKYVKLSNNTSSGGEISKMIDVQTGKFTVSYRYKFTATGNSVSSLLIINRDGTVDTTAASFYINGSKQIVCSGANNITTVIPEYLEENRWYEFSAAIDVENNVWRLSMDGRLLTTNPISFRNPASSINKVRFLASVRSAESNAVTAMIDDWRIYEGTEEPNKAPVISNIAPRDGYSRLDSLEPIELSADIEDSDGSIQSVTFTDADDGSVSYPITNTGNTYKTLIVPSEYRTYRVKITAEDDSGGVTERITSVGFSSLVLLEEFTDHTTTINSTSQPFGASSSTAERFAEIVGDGDKYARIVDNSAGSTAIASYFDFPAQSGKFTLQFDLFIDSNVNINLYLKGARTATAEGAGGYVNCNTGIFTLHSANGSNNAAMPAVDMGGWCTYKFVVDSNSAEGAGRGKYDMYITSNGITQARLNNDFRTGMPGGLSTLMISTNNGAKQTEVLLDNVILLIGGTSYNPPPEVEIISYADSPFVAAGSEQEIVVKTNQSSQDVAEVQLTVDGGSPISLLYDEALRAYKGSVVFETGKRYELRATLILKYDSAITTDTLFVTAYENEKLFPVYISAAPVYDPVLQRYKIIFDNYTGEDKTVTVMAGVFAKGSNKIITYAYKVLTVSGRGEQTLDLSGGPYDRDRYYVRGFVWDNFADMNALEITFDY